MPNPFNGCIETLCRVSSTWLVAGDGNRGSVPWEGVRQLASARGYLMGVEIVGQPTVASSAAYD